jgi:hypothetical protein
MPILPVEISAKRRKSGAPLPSQVRTKLQKVTVRVGEKKVADKVGINTVTLMRAISGLPVQRATVAVITGMIDDLDGLS